MKTIAIVVGHGPKIDQGATNTASGTTELAWNRDLARQIQAFIGTRANAVIVNRVTERIQPTAQTNETNADAAVELHLNAYNGTASGTEMIHHESSKRGKELAIALQRAAVGVLGLPDRGAKGPQGGGRGAGWLANTRMPAVIIESFFVDNNGDLKRGNDKKPELAKAYADTLVAFVGAAAAPAPTPDAIPAQKPAGEPLFRVTGRMSTFGGPKDMGVKSDEGLAIFEPNQVGNGEIGLFLQKQPVGTTGLARRLNPDAFYVACRWDYAKTSKALLRNSIAKVSNKAGKIIQARPVDWGPHKDTGRVADLSPGVAEALGLNTDDIVTVELV